MNPILNRLKSITPQGWLIVIVAALLAAVDAINGSGTVAASQPAAAPIVVPPWLMAILTSLAVGAKTVNTQSNPGGVR